MTQLALGLISFYQRLLSPYKNFSCAYRLHRGGHSCSSFGASVIRRWGLPAGVQLLHRRFRKCGKIHRNAMARLSTRELKQHRLRSQAGHCDVPLVGCDLPAGSCDTGDHSGLLDGCSSLGECGGSPCDFGSSSSDNRREKDRE